MHLCKFFNKIMLLALIALLYTVDFATSLRDVRVKIPHAVRRGEKAILKCLYDLEGDTLYSVKWYKGRREFYSFTPKDAQAMKIFQFTGVKVERSASNESQLVLESVNLATSGKYSCEVSADAPSFHTLISAGELEVVEVPGKDPYISGIRPRYRIGDILRGNCTSRHSKPAANLTWTINGYDPNPSHIRHHKPTKDGRELETAVLGIHFVLTPQHFHNGKLKLRCTAHIHDIYWKSVEKSIEEDRYKQNSGNSINLVHSFSDDYFDVDDENLIDRSDTYMTHIKGDVSSLNANGGAGIQYTILYIPIMPRLITLALLIYTMKQLLLQFIQEYFSYITTTTTMAAAYSNKDNNKNVTVSKGNHWQSGPNAAANIVTTCNQSREEENQQRRRTRSKQRQYDNGMSKESGNCGWNSGSQSDSMITTKKMNSMNTKEKNVNANINANMKWNLQNDTIDIVVIAKRMQQKQQIHSTKRGIEQILRMAAMAMVIFAAIQCCLIALGATATTTRAT